MGLIIPPDNRIIDWEDNKKKIAESRPRRDPNFRLEGPWKEFAYDEGLIKVFYVNNNYIKNNLKTKFSSQAIWYEHEFMPKNEKWITKEAYDIHDVMFNTESQLEAEIQKNAKYKDVSFRLEGPWKRLVEERNGLKIYAVDFDWVFTNLSVMFHHGGHGYVHEFIPKDEIWISYNHHYSCSCKGIIDNKVSERYFESCVRHEILELSLMKNGVDYWTAHNIALDSEKKWKLLEDPYTENYDSL